MSLRRPQRAIGPPRSSVYAALAAALAALGMCGCSTTVTGGAEPNAPRIADVSIEGNRQVDDDDIVEGLANRPPEGFLRRIYRRLDRLALEQDISRIESYYQRRGFFSAKVQGTDIAPAGNGAVEVTFRVVEGPPTHVAGLTIAGVGKTLQSYRSITRAKRPLEIGHIFRHDRYLEFKIWLLDWMAHRGYPHAEVKGEVDVDRDARTADIHLNVDAGPPARFGETEIRGLSRVPESAVRNRLAWEPGERFDPEALELTQGRLYSLGLFGAVRMDYEKKGRPLMTDIRIHLTEARRHELRLGVGGTAEGGVDFEKLRLDVHGRADYTLRGLFSPLAIFRFEARPFWRLDRAEDKTYPGVEATATLERADLFAPHVTGKVAVGYGIDQIELFTSQGPSVRLSMARPFVDDRLRVALGWRFRYLQTSNIADPVDGETEEGVVLMPPAVAFGEIGLDEDPYKLGAFEQAVSWDQRDQPVDSRRGVYAAITVDEGGAAAAGAFSFVRLTGDLRGYLPVGERLVLAGRALYGRALGGDRLPATERFFDGGASGHRGFNFRRLSPFVASTPPAGESPDFAAVGGDQNFLASGEVRYEVGTLANFPFGLVGFADGGDVICDIEGCLPEGKLDFSNLHWAAGLGFRYTPRVSIRVDIAYRLNRYEEGEPDPATKVINRFAYHISVGQAF